MLYHQVLAGGVLRGEYLETDYASFAAWRHWGRPAAAVDDCFGAAAILSRRRRVPAWRHGPAHAGAGRIYFPCGTPDPDDIVDGKVDLDLSVRRELKEETGLDIAEFTAEPGWTTVFDLAANRAYQGPAQRRQRDALRARVLAHLARERQPGACRYPHRA